MRGWLSAALAVYALTVAGCGKSSDAKRTEPAKAKPKPAVLVGSVRIEAGHEELPFYTATEMERSVLAHVKAGSKFPEVCTQQKVDDPVPVRLTPDGKLMGVLLAASEFSVKPDPQPPRVHTVKIEDCRLGPRMVVGLIGDTLHIENRTNYPMMPGLGSEHFSQTMTTGQSRDILLDTGGMKILMCGFNAPCGRTDVVVLAHPYGAVTDDNGEFRIENFPASETVQIHAWHPLFFDTFQTVRVEPGEEKRIELVITPRPAAVPREPFVKDPNMVYPD
ncbi:MAG: hypothetical protein ABW321_01765 [Polyangiales bacterium]